MDIKIENLILNLKKSLLNSINYLINKKISSLKLDEYSDNLNNVNELNKSFINFSKNNIDVFNSRIESIESYIQKFDLLEERISNIENKYDNILNYLEKIDKKINNKNIMVEEKKFNEIKEVEVKEVKEIKKKETDKNNIVNKKNFYQEFIVQDFDIDEKMILECLHNHNIRSDIRLFKEMYIKNVCKEYYPIKNYKKTYQYWKDNHMNNDDENGTYIKNIITTNLANCYLKFNIFENYSNDINLFIKNQDYIINISSDKYKDKILKEIVKIINH
jgi:hypothetical protein